MQRPSSISLQLPSALARILDHIRKRHLALSLAEFPLFLAAAIAIAASLQGIADRILDLTWNTRCALLVLDCLGVTWLAARFIVRPWRQRLDRKAAALLAERCIPAFRSSLISAVELSDPQTPLLPQSRPLVERLLQNTTELALKSNVVARVLRPDRLKKLAYRISWPVLAALALFCICLPVSGIVCRRILLSHATFPARTSVVSVTADLSVDAGGEASLTARATGVIPHTGKLVITRADSSPESIPLSAVTSGGDEFTQVIRNIREPFVYHFVLNDGIGTNHRMSVHYPPLVKEIHFTQIYPTYTGLPETIMSPTAIKLLEGSILRIDATASKPLHSGIIRINGASDPIIAKFTNPEKTAFRAELAIPAADWKSLSVHLEGVEHDPSLNDPEYPVLLERDKPPAVNLSEPKSDSISVVMNSTLPVSFEITDDYGFSAVSLFYQVFRPLPDGSIEQAESSHIPFKIPDNVRSWKRAFKWNLARLLPAVPIGGSIVFWVEVADNNGSASGPTTVRSQEKTIRIVSEEQKRIELLEQMGEKAAQIELLYEQQRSINRQTQSVIK